MTKFTLRLSTEQKNGVPLRRQIVEQIVFQIANGTLEAGSELPSCNELSRRLRVSRNTISKAYQELAGRNWLIFHRGRRMIVRRLDEPVVPREQDLDDLIDKLIHMARQKGYSVDQLRLRIRQRLLNAPPNRVIVVTHENQYGLVLCSELADFLSCPIELLALNELESGKAPIPPVDTLITCLPGLVWNIVPLLPRGRTVIPIIPAKADRHLDLVRNLGRPSLIALVSISPDFLKLAQALLAAEMQGRHTLEVYQLKAGQHRDLSAADLVFCDSLTKAQIKGQAVVPYGIISEETARELGNMIQPSQAGRLASTSAEPAKISRRSAVGG